MGEGSGSAALLSGPADNARAVLWSKTGGGGGGCTDKC